MLKSSKKSHGFASFPTFYAWSEELVTVATSIYVSGFFFVSMFLAFYKPCLCYYWFLSLQDQVNYRITRKAIIKINEKTGFSNGLIYKSQTEQRSGFERSFLGFRRIVSLSLFFSVVERVKRFVERDMCLCNFGNQSLLLIQIYHWLLIVAETNREWVACRHWVQFAWNKDAGPRFLFSNSQPFLYLQFPYWLCKCVFTFYLD